MNRLYALAATMLVALVAAVTYDVPRALVFGWAVFLWRALPRMSADRSTLAVSVVAVLLFAAGVHWLGRSWSARWRPRWTLATVAGVFVAFAAGICLIGMTHQIGWLAAGQEPIMAEIEQPMWRRDELSRNNLSMQVMGLYSFYDTHQGKFAIVPPAGLGVPHGWAISALHGSYFFGNVSGMIDFDRPWNDPRNERFFRGVVPELVNPELRTAPVKNADGFGLAHYAANCRAMTNGAFPQLPAFTDGTANTLLIGEVNANFQPWGSPTNCRDPARGINRSPWGFGGPPHAGGALFAMADGSVRFLSERTKPAVLRALATPDGGEDVDPAVLSRP